MDSFFQCSSCQADEHHVSWMHCLRSSGLCPEHLQKIYLNYLNSVFVSAEANATDILIRKEMEFHPQELCRCLQLFLFFFIIRSPFYLLPAFMIRVNNCHQIRPLSSMTVPSRRKYTSQKSKLFFSTWEQNQHCCSTLFCSWLCKTQVHIDWMEI